MSLDPLCVWGMTRSFPQWLLFVFLLIPAAGAGFAAEPAEKSLLCWWPLDEQSVAQFQDASGHGFKAVAEPARNRGLSPIEGVSGQALHFSGEHLVQVPHSPNFATLQALAFSAWVQVDRFDAYNEIFRKEDGERRVLFSFQEHGTILSLGLNIGGYVECDAPIDPEEMLDGQWHLCAATFDGQSMRVYLDGQLIRTLPRSGKLEAGGEAVACLGSSNGGECLQGALDELKIYSQALSSTEISMLYREAQTRLERLGKGADLAPLVADRSTLAEALAASRDRFLVNRIRDRGTAARVAARLKRQFPADYAELVRVTGLKPAEYLLATNAAWNIREAERLLELAFEYRPLTPAQWAGVNPAARQKWEALEAVERQFNELRSHGEETQCAPEWITVLVEAGRYVQLRPYRQEAVAPYVRPATPITRNLSAAEARALLEKDWLHQAEQQPNARRVQQEITWARQLAQRLSRQSRDRVDCREELAEVSRVETALRQNPEQAKELYFQVRALKRRILFKNPALDFDQLVLVDMPFPQGSEWQHETRHRLGYMAVPGARLLALRGLRPDGDVRQLMPQAPLHGSFWRPDVAFDGHRVLFCFKPHNEKSFHLYEIDADGGNPRQITDGPYDDLDPIYLPDGQHILFSTTRGHTYVRCMPPTSAFVLARTELTGGDIYLVSANNEPDYLPSVMHDGRVLYTRWEYTDKPLWRAQKLWAVNPDGTQVGLFWGNQSVWPDVLKDARCIPGSSRVMFTGSAHHNWFSGSVGVLTPGVGFNFPDGLAKVTADVAWPECGNGPVDPVESAQYHSSGKYEGYYSPYPLSERDFLVSANRAGKFVLYLMDVDGNRELVYEGVHNVFHAIPLKARVKPPVIPDAVDWPVATASNVEPGQGVFFSTDIYQGVPEELAGRAKYLRVLTIDHKTYTYWHQRPYISTGPVISGVQSDGVKRILGTVPIAGDGSVAFQAPAGVPLHFQLLDESQRALHTMRSFANLMPGEIRGCQGCHELHSTAPRNTPHGLGLSWPPRAIAPPPWKDTSVSFARYVRPALDRYCARCHTADGEGRKTLDLTARPAFLGYDETYWLLIGRPSWGTPYQPPAKPAPGWGIADMLMVEAYSTTDPAAYRTPPPMTGLSSRSRLIELAASGKHHDVKLDPVSLLRLQVWVDTLCPYLGDEEVREIPDPEFQGVEWLAVRPQIHTAPTVSRPGPVN